ncbi:MAG: S24/S26 family peptidase [Bacteroidales bacterium]|nr:S24/S26 family peptidase [Bacteroidales bacterium]
MKKMSLPNEEFFSTVEELLAEGKSVSMKPKGNSMIPFIRSGRDTVVLSPLTREVQVGDIVLFVIAGRHILHRVFSIDGDFLTIMGDGNIRGKEHCSRADVVAVVTEIIREGSTVGKAPGKGRLWRFLLPFRRIILAVYRRVIPSDFEKL